jgi:hypothetical protein
MNGIPGFGMSPVEKHVNAGGVPVDKADRFQGSPGRRQIQSPDQYVHVLGITHRRSVHAGDPNGHGIPTDNRVWHLGSIQGSSGSQQAIANVLHGTHHPFENEFGRRCLHGEYGISTRPLPA